jgi:hypothetical protein
VLRPSVKLGDGYPAAHGRLLCNVYMYAYSVAGDLEMKVTTQPQV